MKQATNPFQDPFQLSNTLNKGIYLSALTQILSISHWHPKNILCGVI